VINQISTFAQIFEKFQNAKGTIMLMKASVTDMLRFFASGMMCPPMLIYPYKRIPLEITKTVRDDCGVGRSPAGWVTPEVFYEYTGKVFTSHPGKHIVKFPADLSVDGHHTHIIYQLSELCSEVGITLLSIQTNATRLLQQLDVATFRPLKLGWKISVSKCRRKTSDKILNKDCFTPVLDGALKKYSLDSSAILGFRAFTNGIQKTQTSQNVSEKTNQK
jgi:hypothetical protein